MLEQLWPLNRRTKAAKSWKERTGRTGVSLCNKKPANRCPAAPSSRFLASAGFWVARDFSSSGNCSQGSVVLSLPYRLVLFHSVHTDKNTAKKQGTWRDCEDFWCIARARPLQWWSVLLFNSVVTSRVRRSRCKRYFYFCVCVCVFLCLSSKWGCHLNALLVENAFKPRFVLLSQVELPYRLFYPPSWKPIVSPLQSQTDRLSTNSLHSWK